MVPSRFEEKPMYTISIVADLLNVHPETLRIWERNNLLVPSRRNRQRLYSELDIKRLQFIHTLINEKGLNLAGVSQIISMYPCWNVKNCAGGANREQEPVNQSKPCWKVPGSYCKVIVDRSEMCGTCQYFLNCSFEKSSICQ